MCAANAIVTAWYRVGASRCGPDAPCLASEFRRHVVDMVSCEHGIDLVDGTLC